MDVLVPKGDCAVAVESLLLIVEDMPKRANDARVV